MQTVRWRLFQTASKIVRHGRQIFLQIGADGAPHYAGKRRHSGDVVIPRAGRAHGKPNDGPPPAYLYLKPSKILADKQKIARRGG